MEAELKPDSRWRGHGAVYLDTEAADWLRNRKPDLLKRCGKSLKMEAAQQVFDMVNIELKDVRS